MMIKSDSYYKTIENEDNDTRPCVSPYVTRITTEPLDKVSMRGQEIQCYGNTGYSQWSPNDRVVSSSTSSHRGSRNRYNHNIKYGESSSKDVAHGRKEKTKHPICAYSDNSCNEERNYNAVNFREKYKKKSRNRKANKPHEFRRMTPFHTEYPPHNTATITLAPQEMHHWNANETGELYFLRQLTRSIKNRISLLEYRIATERKYQCDFASQSYRGDCPRLKERAKSPSTASSATYRNVTGKSGKNDQFKSAYCGSQIFSNPSAEKLKDHQTLNTTQGHEVDLYINAEEKEEEF